MKKATLIIEFFSRPEPKKLILSHSHIHQIEMALRYDGKSYEKVGMKRQANMRYSLLKKIKTIMKPSRKR